jgi:two-component sensor histidine kinase
MTGPAVRRSVAPFLVLGLTALFVLVMTAITALLIWQGYYDTLSRTRARAEAAAHVVSVHAQWLIEASNQALRRIDRELGPTANSFVTDSPTLQAELAGLPAEVRLGVYDAAGSRIDSGPADVPANVTDSEYFATLRDGTEWHVSSLILGDAGTDPRFAIARRIVRDGSFVGIAAIFVSASVMEEFWASLDIGQRSTVSMVRTDGWLIARFPSPSAPLNLSEYELFTQHYKAAENGSYVAAQSPADGVPRTVGYRKIDGLPVLALASISTEDTVAQFWRAVTIFLAIVLPALVALVLGATWLAGVMRRDEARRLQLARAVEDNKTLMREIHHRVKNNLQAVSSLVQLQPIPSTSKAEMSRRINAMVSVHEHIYRSDQFARPEVDDYIRTIIENARQGFDAPVEIVYKLEKLHVDKDNAMPLGLIVSEVVSNAFKHAFPEDRQGRIKVTLRAIDDDKGELVIEDNGDGFDVETKSQGMGRRLIEGLAAQLTGTFQYHINSGTRFTLQFPTTDAEPD